MERRLLRTAGHDFIRSEAPPLEGAASGMCFRPQTMWICRLILPAESILYNLPDFVQ